MRTQSFRLTWYKVTDILPDKSGDYLVSDGNAMMVTSFCLDSGRWNVYDKESGQLLIDFWDESHILFWAELPELPVLI